VFALKLLVPRTLLGPKVEVLNDQTSVDPSFTLTVPLERVAVHLQFGDVKEKLDVSEVSLELFPLHFCSDGVGIVLRRGLLFTKMSSCAPSGNPYLIE